MPTLFDLTWPLRNCMFLSMASLQILQVIIKIIVCCCIGKTFRHTIAFSVNAPYFVKVPPMSIQSQLPSWYNSQLLIVVEIKQ
jgi:hypothetical protein